MDDSIKKANSFIDENSKQVEKLKDSIEIFEWDIECLDWLDAADVDFKNASLLEHRLKMERGAIEVVGGYLAKAKAYAHDLEYYKDVKELEERIRASVKIQERLYDTIKTRLALINTINDVQTLKKSILQFKDNSQAEKAIEKATELKQKIKNIQTKQFNIKSDLSIIKSTEIKISTANKYLKKVEAENKQTLKNAGICPFCGKKQ